MNTLRMMRQVIVHPFDFYEDMQSDHYYRWYESLIMVGLVFIVKVLSIYATGFAYQTQEPYEISILQQFVWVTFAWFTWCVAHWGVSAILDGEGKFKQIVHGSAFALVPYVIFILPLTLLTQILALEESGTLNFLLLCVYGWVIWLFLLKVKVLNNFEVGKTLLIILLSLIGMAIIWFIGILLFGLTNQFLNFLFELIKEMRLRV